MERKLTEYLEPFDFWVLAFVDAKTGKTINYYKNTWKRVNTPIEAMHFHTTTWAEKRADENRQNPDVLPKIIRYHADFKAILAEHG